MPIALSVAMVFQSMPATALAAENETEVVGATAENPELDAGGEKEPADDEPEAVNTSVGDTQSGEGSTPTEETSQEIISTAGEESKQEEENTPAESTTQEEASTPVESTAQEEASTLSESIAQEETSTSAESITQEETSTSVESVMQEETTEEISVDKEGLTTTEDGEGITTKITFSDYIKNATLGNGLECKKDADELTFTGVYTENGLFANVIEQTKSYLSITNTNNGKDEDKKDVLTQSNAVHFVYQKPNDKGEYDDDADIDGMPIDAGNYRLRVYTDKVDGLCGTDEAFIYFVIEPATLKLEFKFTDDDDTEKSKKVAPGSKVADLKETIASTYTLKNKDNVEFNKDLTALEAKVYEISSEGVKSEEETKDETFNSEKAYQVEITVTFKDAASGANYEVEKADYYIIQFLGLVESEINVPLKNPGNEQDFISEYDGKELEISSYEQFIDKDKITVTVKDKDEEIPDAVKALVPTWYIMEKYKKIPVYDKEEIEIIDYTTDIKMDPLDENTQFEVPGSETDTVYRYTVLTEKPKDAGEYYIVYVYPGENGKYEKAYSNAIKVTIDPAPLVLRPTVVKLAEGMTEEDVEKALAKVEYKLYKKNNTDYTDAKDDFFGVSYGDKGATQYYQPLFELQSRTEKDKELLPENATEEQKWTEWKEHTGNVTPSTDEKKIEYRIVFTGKKAVYEYDSEEEEFYIYDTVPVTDTTTNSAEKNYRVKADVDTRTSKENVLAVTPTSAIKTTIKTDEIIKPFKGEGTIDSPAWKIYDKKPLYATRAEYKKAVVDGTNVKDTNPSITYTWQQGNMERYKEYLKVNPEDKVAKENALTAFKENFSYYDNTTEESSLTYPKDAGIYRLHIEYKDDTNKNQYSETDVYFQIRQQAVMVVADTQYAEYGDNIYGFTDKGYSVYLIPENDESKFDIKTAERLDLNWKVNASATWQVRREGKKDNGDNTGEYIEYGKDGFTETEFIEDTEKPYNYQAYAYLTNLSGVVTDKYGNKVTDEDGDPVKWSNYTNQKPSYVFEDKDSEAKASYYYQANAIVFNSSEIKLTVNTEKMPKDKTYDAKPIAEAFPEGLVTLTDADGKSIEGLTLNTEAEEKADAVNLYWYWTEDNRRVQIQDAVYGGTYELRASFAGNEKYKAYDGAIQYKDENGVLQPYSFKINKLDIEITPIINTEAKAGDFAGNLIGEQNAPYTVKYSETVPAEDKWLFEYVDKTEYSILGTEYYVNRGFPLFASANKYDSSNFEQDIYADGVKINNIWNTYLRSGKNYTVKFGYRNDRIVLPWKNSYNITYKTSEPVKVARGTADIDGAEIQIDKYKYVEDYENDYYGWMWTKEPLENSYVNVAWDVDKSEFTITPREGIPFVYGGGEDMQFKDASGKDIPFDKNYIAYRIYAPKEFEGSNNWNDGSFASEKQTFIYENNIKAAGGYILNEWEKEYREGVCRHYITVIFPVEKDGTSGTNKSVKPFSITWEDGYTETFKLDVTNAVLESNLKKAVAPKSLAFNGVQAKMAVGETQDLDVKITKAQLGDVIQINYRLASGAPDNIVSIDTETGRLTALATADHKPTVVNIEAYPVRLSDDGKTYEEITDKGVKVAKTKVTVTEVTAPVIKKVIPKDTWVDLQFTHVDDGYRREIYVVKVDSKAEIKQWNAAQFETTIEGMDNAAQWKDAGFAIAPKYIRWNIYDKTLKLDKSTLYGLETNGIYVVYVRNVSAVRTLADGSSKVTLSAAGSVKNFVSTKSQVECLEPWFTVTETENDTKNPVKYANRDENGNIVPSNVITDDTLVRYFKGTDKYDHKIPEYIVDFSAKSAQLSVDGWFDETLVNEAAKTGDIIRKKLPLKSTDRSLLDKYLEPKLTYFIADGQWLQFDTKTNKIITKPSVYATVNNKGKITFKGTDVNGDAKVYVFAVADNEVADYCILHIVAKADTITAKKAKMKVGDQVRLASLLTYKEGKKKIPNYRSTKIEITEEDIVKAEAAGFRLHQASSGEMIKQDEYCVEGEWIITAVKAGNTSLNIKDMSVGESGTAVTLNLTAAQLDPVKKLKVGYVDDKHITLNFAHAGNPEAFDVEVKDARGSVIYKKLVWNNNDSYYGMEYDDNDNATVFYNDQKVLVKANAKTYWQEWQRSIVNIPDDDGDTHNFAYFEKTKTYAYTIDCNKLVRLSAYTVTVMPVYEGEKAAKPATVKAKTTNTPASYENMNVENPEIYGGIYIGKDSYLTSGNTYTLSASVENYFAKDRATDVLTWKSSNKKVASIKANAGSFTATLKAQQQGTTVITVTSKVTKKVIARKLIAVKAVSDGRTYSGDYENSGNSGDYFHDSILSKYDPLYQGRLEVLTLSNKVTVDENYLSTVYQKLYSYNDVTWVEFTAPSYGEYTFECWDLSEEYYRGFEIYNSRKLSANGGDSNGEVSLKLEAGQKIYFRINGTFKLEVSDYTDFSRLTIANATEKTALNVPKTSWISFTAPEDNYYTFKTAGSASIIGYEGVLVENNSAGMLAGQTVFINVDVDKYNNKKAALYVEYRTADKTVTVDTPADVTFTPDDVEASKDYAEKWVRFTAPDTAWYTFKADRTVKADFYNLTSGNTLSADDIVLASEVYTLATDGETQDKSVGLKKLFIEKGVSVMFKLTVRKDAFTGDDKDKIQVKVSVESSEIKTLTTETSQTVKAGTTATLKFQIPEEYGRYSFKVENGTIGKWHDSEYKNITTKDQDLLIVNSDKTTNWYNEDWIEIKAGDIVYLDVTSTDDKKDAAVSVTKTNGDNKLELGKEAELKLTKGYEGWYTFTVPATGYYEFGATLPKDTEAQCLEVKRVDGVFKETTNSLTGNENIQFAGNGSAIKKLNIGDTVVLKASAGNSVDEKASITANLYVKEVEITPLELNVDTSVSIDQKNGVKYYSFTATEGDYYTFKYTPSEESKGEYEVHMGTSLECTSGLTSEYLNANGTRYIKVQQTDETKIEGTLKVTPYRLSKKPLASGKTDFSLKKGESQTYTFVPPVKSILGYNVIVANDTSVKEPETKPAVNVTVDGSTYSVTNTKCIDAHTWRYNTSVYTVEISASADVEGSITISPITAAAFDGKEVSVTPAANIWYQYEVTEAGRYTLSAETKNGAICQWYKYNESENYGWLNSVYYSDYAPGYLKKGDVIYAEVYTDTEPTDKTKPTATVNAPAKITPVSLPIDEEKDVKLGDKQSVAYYEFIADAYATYSVTGSYNFKRSDSVDDWTNGSELDEGEKVLVIVTSNTKLKVTKSTITELKNGETAKGTLEAEKSASYVYHAYNKDYITFKATANKVNISVSGNTNDIIYDGSFYKVVGCKTGDKVLITVSNLGSEEVNFELAAAKFAPTAIASEFKVSSYEIGWYEYTADKEGVYAFEIKKGEDVVTPVLYQNNDGTYTSISSPVDLEAGGKVLFRVDNMTDKEETYKFAATVKEPVYNNTLVFETYGDTKTIKFTAPYSGEYKITGYTQDEGAFYVDSKAFSGRQYIYSNNNKKNHRIWNTSFLFKGDEVVIDISAQNSGKHSVSIKIDIANEPTVLKDSVEESGSLGINKTRYFVYTAEKDATYEVIKTGAPYLYYRMDGNSDWERIEGDRNDIEKIISLKASETIHLKIQNPYGNVYDYTLKVKEFQTTTLDASQIDVKLDAEADVVYEYAAPENGNYIIDLQGQNYRSFDKYYALGNGVYKQFNESAYIQLNKGDNVLIKLRNKDTAESSSTLIMQKLASIKEGSWNDKIAGGDYAYFEFTPEDDDLYFYEKNTNMVGNYDIEYCIGLLNANNPSELSFVSVYDKRHFTGTVVLRVQNKVDSESEYVFNIEKEKVDENNRFELTFSESGDEQTVDFKFDDQKQYTVFVIGDKDCQFKVNYVESGSKRWCYVSNKGTNEFTCSGANQKLSVTMTRNWGSQENRTITIIILEKNNATTSTL